MGILLSNEKHYFIVWYTCYLFKKNQYMIAPTLFPLIYISFLDRGGRGGGGAGVREKLKLKLNSH